MKIEEIELRVVAIPAVRPFAISSSTTDVFHHVIVTARADGLAGYGESPSTNGPYYCPETVETCWHVLRDVLSPSVIGVDFSSVDQLSARWNTIKGNRFAIAGLETACWDLLAKSQGQSLSTLLGGTRTEVLSGVSLGIQEDIGLLFELIERFVGEGYRRIKLKIAPGKDVDVLRQVRRRWADLPLTADANSAYTPADVDTLKQLDEFHLAMIEQPLWHDDIIAHARLQEQLDTPICLDESILSVRHARQALELGACRIINIKVSRLGGLLAAKRVHDFCRERNVPVWCGGMHEFGIGRAANIAIASLPGFTLPGDVCGFDKDYADDIVRPYIRARQGAIKVPTAPGLGYEIDQAKLDGYTVRKTLIKEK